MDKQSSNNIIVGGDVGVLCFDIIGVGVSVSCRGVRVGIRAS